METHKINETKRKMRTKKAKEKRTMKNIEEKKQKTAMKIVEKILILWARNNWPLLLLQKKREKNLM